MDLKIVEYEDAHKISLVENGSQAVLVLTTSSSCHLSHYVSE